MDCKEAERQISFFLKDELSEECLSEFVEHINKCQECKEELAIQYLATEGVVRLEEGASFSLEEELKSRLGAAEHKLRISVIINRICNNLETVAIILLGIAITYMVW